MVRFVLMAIIFILVVMWYLPTIQRFLDRVVTAYKSRYTAFKRKKSTKLNENEVKK